MKTNDEAEHIYCHCEPGAFPASQFLRDDQGQLLVPFVHVVSTEYPHYVTGVPFAAANPDMPGLRGMPGTLLHNLMDFFGSQPGILNTDPAEWKRLIERMAELQRRR